MARAMGGAAGRPVVSAGGEGTRRVVVVDMAAPVLMTALGVENYYDVA
jgi:predicted polyphosphate/ATP-dependent NAD kinase